MTQSDFADTSDAIWPGFARHGAKVMRLLLIDDHPIVREGICALLSLESDLSIVGDCGDVESGIEMVRRLEPDLVICDLTMPGCTGGIAVRMLCRECPTTRVMVLTAHDSLECVRESFSAGAIGYVRKDALRADLMASVRNAASCLSRPSICFWIMPVMCCVALAIAVSMDFWSTASAPALKKSFALISTMNFMAISKAARSLAD